MLNDEVLAKMIHKNLTDEGFSLISQNEKFIKAISKAIVEHIQAFADVKVISGSSRGVYKIS